MRIGEVARKSGVHIQTVRFYESKRLLREPPRTGAGYRNYSDMDVEQIKFIKWCQPLGFTLKEVADLVRLHSAVVNLAVGGAPSRPAQLQAIVRMAEGKFQDLQKRVTLLKLAARQLKVAIKKLQSEGGPVCPGAATGKNAGGTRCPVN